MLKSLSKLPYKHNEIEKETTYKHNGPCPSFITAAVIKKLKTFLNTSASKIVLGEPPSQASMIMALGKENTSVKGNSKERRKMYCNL